MRTASLCCPRSCPRNSRQGWTTSGCLPDGQAVPRPCPRGPRGACDKTASATLRPAPNEVLRTRPDGCANVGQVDRERRGPRSRTPLAAGLGARNAVPFCPALLRLALASGSRHPRLVEERVYGRSGRLLSWTTQPVATTSPTVGLRQGFLGSRRQ